MRLITAIGCCLLLATFVTANPDVSHLKYMRRGFKKHLTTTTTTTLAPNTKSDVVRKERTYLYKPRLIIRKGKRIEKLTTEMLTTITTLPPTTLITVADTKATEITTAATTSPPTTMETTENDDTLSVINNSDSLSSSGSYGKRNERDGKSLQDAWDIRHNIPGEPGVDYPIYFEAPDSKFDCENRHDGYYADTEARCQVFHVCANTAIEERGFIFLCPNGTVFSQENFVCDWYTNVNCPDSERYYYKNEELGTFIGSKEEMLLEVQKMFDYTLRNLLNNRTISNENGIDENSGDGNSIAGNNLNQPQFGNFSTIPVLNSKMRKPTNKTKGRLLNKTAKDEVYISNLGELSTDPDADFNLDVVKEQAKVKWEAARKSKEGSFAELWGKDVDQLDTILNQNRLKKSSDGQLFFGGAEPTPAPSASTITKRDVSHLQTTPEYFPSNRYLPSLPKLIDRPLTGYHYHRPTRPVSLIDTITTTESYVTDTMRRTRPPTTERVFTRQPTPTKTTIVTAVTYPTTAAPVTTKRRPTFSFDVTNKSDSLLEYRGQFQTTENIRGDQTPDDDFYDDVVDFDSKKDKPDSNFKTGTQTSNQDTQNLINTLFVMSPTNKNDPAALIDDENTTNFPLISSTERTRLDDTIVTNKKVTMMKRPIILLMPPYKINRTMDNRQEIGLVNENSLRQTKPSIDQNTENLMVVFASSENISNSSEDVILQNKINYVEPFTITPNIETTTQNVDEINQLHRTNEYEGGALLIVPPFGDEQSTIGSIINEIGQTGGPVDPNVKISTQIIDLEDEILIDPDQLKIHIRPEIEQTGADQIESTTIRMDTKQNVELPQPENVQTNIRDDRLALIQKMIKMLEQKMKLKQGDLPPVTDEPPSVVTSRFLQTTTTSRPVTQFSIDNIIKEVDTTQAQGVGANLIFAMMKILENAQNKSRIALNARPGDGSILQPIFSSLNSNAQTDSPIKIRDEDILNNDDILSKTITLLQNSDDDELKSILEVNEIQQIRKDGNLIFDQTTPKSGTTGSPQIVGVVESHNPQIMIKEVFRNRNNGPTTIDSKPVIKYSFGTQINNGEPYQETGFSEGTAMKGPFSAIKTTFDSPQGTKENDPFVSISKTRLSEIAPSKKPSIVAPAPAQITEYNLEDYNQELDPSLAISKTRLAEIAPASEPSPDTLQPAAKPSFESPYFNNRGSDPSLTISKTRIAAISPAGEPSPVKLQPVTGTTFDFQNYNRVNGKVVPLNQQSASFNSQTDPSQPQAISQTQVRPAKEPSRVTVKPAIQIEFNSQQYHRENDPSLTISKTRIAEVAPTTQPASGTLQPFKDSLFNSQQYNRVDESSQDIPKTQIAEAERANEPKPVIQIEYTAQPYNQVYDPALSISNSGTPQYTPTNELSPTLNPLLKFSFGTQISNELGDLTHTLEIKEGAPGNDSISPTIITNTFDLQPLNERYSFTSNPIIKTTFDLQQDTGVGDPSFDISKTRIAGFDNSVTEPSPAISKTQIAEAIPLVEPPSFTFEDSIKSTYDTQQNNRVNEPSLSISKTRIAEVEPTRQPFRMASEPIMRDSFNSQPYNQVSDPSLVISKTRIAEVEPTREPFRILSEPVTKTSFNSQPYNKVSDPSLVVSKTRISEVEPTKEPFRILSEPVTKTSFNSQPYNQMSDPALVVSKTRIAEVEPTREPFRILSEPIAKTSFNSQPYNQVSDPSLVVSKTRISEVEPTRKPFRILSEPITKTSFNSQPYNQVSDPSLVVSKTRISEVEPTREPFRILSEPVTKTSFNSQPYNQVRDPSLVVSKTRIAEVEPTKEPFRILSEPVTKTSFNSQPYNQVSDPSLVVSKTRIAEVEPTREPFRVTSEPVTKTSSNVQPYNQVSDPSLSISKTRISEVAPVSGPYPVIKPLKSFSFETEINNLAYQPNRPNSENVIKLTEDDLVSQFAEDTGQIKMPKAVQSDNEVQVQGLLDSNFNNKGPVVEPLVTSTIPRIDGARSNTPKIIQIVPETYHNVVKESVIPDLADSDISQSDANVRVEGKFTGFLNNNPDQYNLGVKSKGYVYENKLSPEVLKLYNINTIDTPTSTTFQPSSIPVTPNIVYSSSTNPTPVLVSTTTTTPKPVLTTTTTTPKPLTTVTTTTTTTSRPIVLTRPEPTTTPKSVSEAPFFIRVEDSIGEKRKAVDEIPKVIFVSSPSTVNPLTVQNTIPSAEPISGKTNVTPTVPVQEHIIQIRPQQTVTSTPQKRPPIAIKTVTQKPVSTLQPGPQTYILNSDNPTLSIHQNLLKEIPGIVITPSISQSLGQTITQEGGYPKRVSPPQSISTNIIQQQRPRPVQQQQQQEVSFVFPKQPFESTQAKTGIAGLQDAQARRPLHEQQQIVFPNQRPQLQSNTNQFTSSQYQIQQQQRGQLLSQIYEKPLLLDRPVPEPVISSQYPFGTEQQVNFDNGPNGQHGGKNSVIVSIVPSINWYLNDAHDRNSYFQAIQRGIIPNDNVQFNSGHLRYGVPFEFKNQNSYAQQRNGQYNVLGAREHARQSEFTFPNINHIPLGMHTQFFKRTGIAGTDFVENSNRRSDDSNAVSDGVESEKDSVFHGLTSYNAPLASVGKLPCDSDSVSGGGHSKNPCFN